MCDLKLEHGLADRAHQAGDGPCRDGKVAQRGFLTGLCRERLALKRQTQSGGCWKRRLTIHSGPQRSQHVSRPCLPSQTTSATLSGLPGPTPGSTDKGREAVVRSVMSRGRRVHVCCAQAAGVEKEPRREERHGQAWEELQAALVSALCHALPDREVTCSGTGGEVDVEQVGLVVVCASQRLVNDVNERQGRNWMQWRALVLRKELPFVVVVLEPEASQEHWTGGFALQASRAAAVVDLTGEEKDIVEDAVANIVLHVEPEEEDDQQGSEDDVVFALNGFDPLHVAREKSVLYVEGTRAWALDEFRAWANRSASVWASERVLVFVGPAGFGKSVLMARICDENGLLDDDDDDDGADEARSPARKKRRSIPLLSMLGGKKTQEQTVVKVRAAHFFKHDDKQACDLKTCLLSVANQLSAVLPTYREEIAKLDKTEILHGLGPAVLFDRLITEPMSKVPEPSERVVVLLDALDEVTEADRGVLQHIVRNMWHTETPEWLGLVLSTRPGDPIRDTLEVFRPTMLQLDDERNLTDLEHFLETRLRRHLAHVDRDLERAVEILAERAEGLFLYAYFVDQTLVGRESKVASLEELEEVFPDVGIDDMYQSYFSRLLEGPLHGDQEMYGVLLGTLVATRSPVPRDVLQAAVRLEDAQKFDEILARSEQLLAVGPETVRFIHKSMSDFVKDRRRAGGRLVVDADVGHMELSRVVVDAPAFMRSSPFLLRHSLFHLGKANKRDAVADWLLDFCNVHQALHHADPMELVSDVDEKSVPMVAVDVLRVLQLGTTALRYDPDELAGQILGRISEEDHPFRASLEHQWQPSKAWIRPRWGDVLTSVQNPCRKVLHTGLNRLSHGSSCISADGRIAVCAGTVDKACVVQVWDVATSSLRFQCQPPAPDAWGWDCDSVSISANGSFAVTSGGSLARVWDLRCGGIVKHCLEGTVEGQGLISADASIVLVACRSLLPGEEEAHLSVRIWDIGSGELVQELRSSSPIPAGTVDEVRFGCMSRDSSICAFLTWSIVGRTGTLWMWDLEARREMSCVHLQGRCPEDVATASGQVIVVSLRDSIVVVDSQDASIRATLRVQKCLCIAIAADDRTVVYCDGKWLCVWNLDLGVTVAAFRYFAAAVDLSLESLLTMDGAGHLAIWDLSVLDPQEHSAPDQRNERCHFWKLSADSQSLVTLSSVFDPHQKRVKFWNFASGRMVNEFEITPMPYISDGGALEGCFDYDSSSDLSTVMMMSCGARLVRVFDGRNGDEKQRFSFPLVDGRVLEDGRISPSGRTVAAHNTFGDCLVWSCESDTAIAVSGKGIEKPHASAVWVFDFMSASATRITNECAGRAPCVEFSGDGKEVLLFHETTSVSQRVDLQTGRISNSSGDIWIAHPDRLRGTNVIGFHFDERVQFEGQHQISAKVAIAIMVEGGDFPMALKVCDVERKKSLPG